MDQQLESRRIYHTKTTSRRAMIVITI